MFDIEHIIKTAGYIGLTAIIFAESGLFFGFFLPGDSLLFTAGFLASQGYLNIFLLAIVTFVAAVVGDNVGYEFGKYSGPKLFNKPESKFFKPEHLKTAHEFYKKNGGKTIIIARFMPFVRTFAPIVAGAGNMPHKTFMFYNLIGGALWTLGLCFGGYYLGKIIPNADKYILPIVAVIIIVSVLPAAIKFLKIKK